MKMVGIVLFLLFLSFSTGEKTKCYSCHSRDSQYCEGKEIICPEGSVCMTVSEKLGFNQTYYSIEQRCSMNLNCTANLYSYVDDNLYYELSYKCCKGDLCNNGSTSFINKTYDYDGPECPICASFDTLEKCKPVAATVCRSATDQCSYFIGWLKKPDGGKTKVSVQGCMSNEACKYDHSQMVGYTMEKIVDRKCYIPKPSQA